MGAESDGVLATLQSKHFGWSRGGGGGAQGSSIKAPSEEGKHERRQRQQECAVEMCTGPRVEESEGRLQGGHEDSGPAAKPRVSVRFISLASPALRGNQARSNMELSICYPRRQREGRELGNQEEKGGSGG